MARKQGIKSELLGDGTIVFLLDSGRRRIEFNPAGCSEEMRRNAMNAGFIRVISNVAAGEVQKGDWASIEREMNRRITGIKRGMWSIRTGGFGFADHVEAVVRIAAAAGKPLTHEAVEQLLLAKSTEERNAHAAKPLVARTIAQIRAERLAATVDDDESGLDVLDSLE